MKHARGFAELALVVTAVLLVAACGKGPGEPPKSLPTWSPPDWMHGSWSGTGVAGDGTTPVTGTVEVSAYNLEASFEAGGMAYPLDVKMAEQGGASIHAIPGSNQGKPEFSIRIVPDAGGTEHMFLCGQEDSTTMNCVWTQLTPPDTDGTVLGFVGLTKQ